MYKCMNVAVTMSFSLCMCVSVIVSLRVCDMRATFNVSNDDV